MEDVNAKFQAGVAVPGAEVKDKRKHADVSSASTRDRCRIVINESDNPQELNECTVQVNGRTYQMQRGKEVAVPPEVIEALNNAVVDKAIPFVNEQGITQGFTLRPTKRFPYSYVDPESQVVFNKWKKASLDLRDAQIAAELERQAA